MAVKAISATIKFRSTSPNTLIYKIASIAQTPPIKMISKIIKGKSFKSRLASVLKKPSSEIINMDVGVLKSCLDR